MAQDPDFERIRRKAHELWEAEGRPHGRNQDHWDQAREIIAIEDSQASTLLPRTTGADEPSEPTLAVESLGDVPGLTDQGKDDLTDTSREPGASSAPAPAMMGETVQGTKPAIAKAPPKPAAAKAPEKPVPAAKPAPAKPAPVKPVSAKPAVAAAASPAAISSGPVSSKPAAAKPQRAPK